METLDYDYSVHQTDADDKKLSVLFYSSFIKNDGKSEAEGRPIMDDVPFVRIMTPGDRMNIIDRPVRPTDKLRFAMQWNRFKALEEQIGDGTPLAQWPIISRGQAEELKYFGFMTVEQVAEANDGINYMGLQDLKKKAKSFIELAKGGAPIERLTREAEEAKTNLKVAMEAIELMKAEMASLKAAQTKAK